MSWVIIDTTKFDNATDSISDSRAELLKMSENDNTIDLSGITNGQGLVYNSTTGKLEAGTVSGGGSVSTFATIAISGQSDVVADATNDTLTLVAGSNVTLTTNASTDTITIASTGGGSVSELDDLTDGYTLNGSGILCVGVNAGNATTTASQTTAFGWNALGSITNGIQNVAVGANAMYSATTSDESVAVGCNALTNIVGGGGGNTAVGHQALSGATSSTCFNNVGIGKSTMVAITTGYNNTAIGNSALGNILSGKYNSALGNSSLLYLQSGGGNNTTEYSTGLGYDARVSGNNQVQLGASTTTTYAYGSVQNRSDLRDKADVRDTALGLDFINALRPVDFKWDYRESYDVLDDETGELTKLPKDGSKKRSRYHHGIIAQELETVLSDLGIDFGGFQDHSINGGNDVKSIGYEELIAPMIKAIQELTQQVNELRGN